MRESAPLCAVRFSIVCRNCACSRDALRASETLLPSVCPLSRHLTAVGCMLDVCSLCSAFGITSLHANFLGCHMRWFLVVDIQPLVCRLEDYWVGYKLFCYAYYSHSFPHVSEFRNSKLGSSISFSVWLPHVVHWVWGFHMLFSVHVQCVW